MSEYYESSWRVIKQGTDNKPKAATITCSSCHTTPVWLEGETCYQCQADALDAKAEKICAVYEWCTECGKMPVKGGGICGRCRGKRSNQNVG